jgi:hypothetical protein
METGGRYLATLLRSPLLAGRAQLSSGGARGRLLGRPFLLALASSS